MRINLLPAALIAAGFFLSLTSCTNLVCDGCPNTSTPIIYRTDLKFGYYGTHGVQDVETVSHVNVVIDMMWDGEDAAVARLRGSAIPTILGIESYIRRPDAGLALEHLITNLQINGVWNDVLGFYLIDEPDIAVRDRTITSEQIIAAGVLIRQLSANAAKPHIILPVIYSNPTALVLPAQGIFDWVGYDNYPAGDKIFFNGEYKRFRDRVGANQSLVLVAGGAEPWENDPTIFSNVAHNDSKVAALIGFIWFDGWDLTNPGRKGIRSGKMKEKYVAVGAKIIGK